MKRTTAQVLTLWGAAAVALSSCTPHSSPHSSPQGAPPAAAQESVMKSKEEAALLKVTLLAPLVFDADAPVLLQMQVSNATTTAGRFCTYHTPFEGLRNDLFVITTAAGALVPYSGMMAKRVPPSPEDFRMLKAGETLLSDPVDLRKGYTLPPGRYSIAFEGNGISGLPASAPVLVEIRQQR